MSALVTDASIAGSGYNARTEYPLALLEVARAQSYAAVAPRLWQYDVPISISIYHAAYLDSALRERLPLATVDKAVLRAAEPSGVALFQL